MGRSNIDVKSNLYIRAAGTYSKDKDLPERDEKFASQIMDADCLRVLINRAEESGTDLQITEAQWQLMVVRSCEYCPTGEMTHGLVKRDGVVVAERRCTVEDCPHAYECGRVEAPEANPAEEDDLFKELAQLGADIGNIFADPEGDNSNNDNSQNAQNGVMGDSDNSKAIAGIMKDKAEYFEISAEDAVSRVIAAPLSDKILLDGAAGVGKTYTAVQRLAHIIGGAEGGKTPKILVLCHTENTAGDIKNRLKARLEQMAQNSADGRLSAVYSQIFSQIEPDTLDVFLVKYLSQKGCSAAELKKMPFSKRAALFKEKSAAEDFAPFDYCIIDELQEADGERGEIISLILKSLKCGYLLLEDKKKAAIGSTEGRAGQYIALRQALPRDIRKFTLIGNKRQTESLDKMSGELRERLLCDTPAQVLALCQRQLDVLMWELVEDDFKITDLGGSTAILCRKGGDAEYISWLLNKNGTPHTLIRENSADLSICRYLADVLWDRREATIDRAAFTKRFVMRCCPDEGRADEFFSALLAYSVGELGELGDSSRDNEVLDCDKLADRLACGGELPQIILNARDDKLAVCTIDGANGREFDRVYLLGYDFPPNGLEECGALFYQAQTRAKKELKILRHPSKWAFKKSEDNRWIRTQREAYKTKSQCVGYATCGADVDCYSFVEGDMAEAVGRQAYISQNVKCGDEVYLRLAGEEYEIIHGETAIGRMSKSYSQSLMGEFGGKRYLEKLPERISRLFVSNIITFVSLLDEDSADINITEQFKKKRFWLGVEISGFGVI